MWWRFVVFCFLVSFILFVVLNYLHDRPVIHFKYFKRCCEDVNENDQIVYEKFINNFLKERLVAFEFESSNGTFVPDDVNIEEVMEVMREKMNVHDPNSRRIVGSFEELFSSTIKNDINDANFEEIGDELSIYKNEETDIEKDELDVFGPNEIGTSKGVEVGLLAIKRDMNNVTKNDDFNEVVIRNSETFNEDINVNLANSSDLKVSSVEISDQGS